MIVSYTQNTEDIIEPMELLILAKILSKRRRKRQSIINTTVTDLTASLCSDRRTIIKYLTQLEAKGYIKQIGRGITILKWKLPIKVPVIFFTLISADQLSKIEAATLLLIRNVVDKEDMSYKGSVSDLIKDINITDPRHIYTLREKGFLSIYPSKYIMLTNTPIDWKLEAFIEELKVFRIQEKLEKTYHERTINKRLINLEKAVSKIDTAILEL